MVAMIGAISLTMRKRVGVRRQSISDQINRRPEDVLEVVTIPSGIAQKKTKALVFFCAMPDGIVTTSSTSSGRRLI